MAYVINRWNGTALTSVEDGSVDQAFDIKFIGKNYAGYGEIQNESFLHLLENFSGPVAPPNAVSGQLWYDTASKKIKFFTGDQVSGAKVWKTAGAAEYAATSPINPVPGELWLDSTTSQLKVRGANGWVTIGPDTAGATLTQMISREVKDTNGTVRPIITATINDEVICIIAGGDFDIDINDEASRISGFNTVQNSKIKKGITLPYTNDLGVSVNGPSTRMWGTAGSALGLVDQAGNLIDISKFVTIGDTASNFPDPGFLVGDDSDFAIYIRSNGTPVIENVTGNRIQFNVTNNGTVISPVVITASGVEPGNSVSSLGTADNRWNAVHATTFNGTATNANLIRSIDNTFIGTAIAATPNTVAVRDSSGDITARNFLGTASNADTLRVGGDYRTASVSNTANAIVSRDSVGNFSAGTITATLDGNAKTASKLASNITVNGTSFDGSASITVTANTSNSLTRGSYLTGSNFNGSAATTWAVDATTNNTVNKIVARNSLGDIYVNTVYGSLSGNATTATTATTATSATTATTATTATNLTGGRALVQDGSAASPSLAFISDGARDTGFYWGGDGYINIATNGQYRGNFNPSGDLTITGGFVGRGVVRLQGLIAGNAGYASGQGTGVVVSRLGAGQYRVYHNLNTRNYVPMVTITMPTSAMTAPNRNIDMYVVSIVAREPTYFDIYSTTLTSYILQAGGNDNNQPQTFIRTLADIGEIYFTAHTF